MDFFDLASNWGEIRQVEVVFRRSLQGDWFARAILKDGNGPFFGEVRQMTQRRKHETDVEFADRVWSEMGKAVARARAARIPRQVDSVTQAQQQVA